MQGLCQIQQGKLTDVMYILLVDCTLSWSISISVLLVLTSSSASCDTIPWTTILQNRTSNCTYGTTASACAIKTCHCRDKIESGILVNVKVTWPYMHTDGIAKPIFSEICFDFGCNFDHFVYFWAKMRLVSKFPLESHLFK